MDVADGTLFGQRSRLQLLAYAGIVLHRRVRMFAVTSQMLHVVPCSSERHHRDHGPRSAGRLPRSVFHRKLRSGGAWA
jgi:hypothetical protein